MKIPVQILLLIALPFAGVAREETMEQRKQRIMRKYMRERVNVAQSDMVVPQAATEDEQVAQARQFSETVESLDRQRVSPPQPAIQPPPQSRRPVPRKQERNWLLDESTLDLDPFAALYDAGLETDPDKTERSKSRTPSAYDAYIERRQKASTERGIFGERAPAQERQGYRATTQGGAIFGRREQDASTGYGGLGFQRKTYGMSPDKGLLSTQFPRSAARAREQSSRDALEKQNTVPYKSPFQRQREQQQQQGGQKRQQEFIKQDPYQQWKDRQKVWDPTKDDAYLDELMQHQQR